MQEQILNYIHSVTTTSSYGAPVQTSTDYTRQQKNLFFMLLTVFQLFLIG